MNNIVAVVVTYNRKDFLKECIESLLGQETKCDISIIDNASDDGTYEYIEDMISTCPNISYTRLEVNEGGAGGFAAGMEDAVLKGYEYIWIMDDDTMPNSDALSKLMEAAKRVDNRFGFLSSTVNWVDGSPCKMNKQTPSLHPTSLQKVNREYGLKAVDAATFVSLLFRREAVMLEGLPMKEYFIWGDDKEYTQRLSRNYDCYNVVDSIVVHKMANNEGSNIKTDDVARIDRYYYAYRNDLATAKAAGGKAVAIYYAAFFLNNLRVIFSTSKGKGKRLKVMWKGMFAGIKFKPDVKYVKRISLD